MSIGFGIDLAGYTTGKTALAVVDIQGAAITATLLRGSALSIKRQSSARLSEVLSQDVSVMRRCFAIGPIAVDTPIDFQGLPNPVSPERIWQLTRRPIDRALNAMPPFADRIGSPAARFAAIMREGNFSPLLGDRLFEAYPAATWKMLKIDAGKYKGADGSVALISLCKTLNMEPALQNDDDIDAIICAITAALPSDQIQSQEAFKVEGEMPKGFRIPKHLAFQRIDVTTSDFEAWMKNCEVGHG